jgi:hypothetical protein
MKRFFPALILAAIVCGLFFQKETIAGSSALKSAPPAAQRGRLAIRFAPRQITEVNKKQRYSIKAKYPQAIGAGRDQRLARLNEELRKLIAKEVSDFKTDFQPPEEPLGEMESSYDSAYWVNLATNDLVSISFGVSTYGEGAAHPNHNTLVFNYDLNAGRTLQLSDLFKPNSNYLGVISRYTITALKKKFAPDPDTDWIERGAGPSEENYNDWSLTRGGLQITFDPYQVASYAEGEHVVVVPYAVLKDLIDPNGPLPAIVGQQRGARR